MNELECENHKSTLGKWCIKYDNADDGKFMENYLKTLSSEELGKLSLFCSMLLHSGK